MNERDLANALGLPFSSNQGFGAPSAAAFAVLNLGAHTYVVFPSYGYLCAGMILGVNFDRRRDWLA